MKIRKGFISNSSSSSFVIVCDDKEYFNVTSLQYLGNKEVLNIPEDLHNPYYQFGWEWNCYSRFEEKVCWAILQAQFMEEYVPVLTKDCNKPYHKLIFEVVNRIFGVEEIDIEININSGAWIDHSSCAYEDSSQLEIFESFDTLTQFLFNTKSYISTGNDNEDGVRSEPEGEPITPVREKIAEKDARERREAKEPEGEDAEVQMMITRGEFYDCLQTAREKPNLSWKDVLNEVLSKDKYAQLYKTRCESILDMSKEELIDLAKKNIKKEIYGL